MKPILLPIVFLTLFTSGWTQAIPPKSYKLADYNFVAGTQMIGAKYKFTKDSYLVEQAKQIRGMGSNVLKITLGKNYFESYPDLVKDPTMRSTVEILKGQKEYRKIFDMDFKYIFMWVHTLTGVKWLKPMSDQDKLKIYQEMYDLAEHLLREYSGSGKTFMIGNWEGDWLLHGVGKPNVNPSKERINAMTDWFKIRQAAIDDAKRKNPTSDVGLFYYVEVNLVKKGLQGRTCITESVLENVNPDMVSYSSYESIKKHPNYESLKSTVGELMDYIESKLKPKENIPFKRRVFIGEYGYQVSQRNTKEDQCRETKDVIKASLELNLPFALHWEMYNNEYSDKGESKGMSLINEEGEKKPVYYLHKNYYKKTNEYLFSYMKKNGRYPSTSEFRIKAVDILDSL